MTAKTVPPLNPSAATTAEVAQVCGVSTEAVQSWKVKIPREAGIWSEVKGGRGRGGIQNQWDLPRLIEWRMEQAAATAVAKVRPSVEMTPLEQEQLRKFKSHNDERDRLLVNRADLDRQWAKAGGELRGRLEILGRRHGPVVANDLARLMVDLSRSMHGLLGKGE